MTGSSIKMDNDSDQEHQSVSQQYRQTAGGNIPNGIHELTGSSDVAVLRDENCRLLTTLLEYKKMLENTKLRYGTVKREFYAAKKRMKRMANKLQLTGGAVNSRDGSESGDSNMQSGMGSVGGGAPVDDEIRKKWKEPNLKAAVKLKAAIGLQAYISLIREGELQLPSLRTISRYIDALKKAGLKPNYDFNVRDDDSVGNVFEELNEDSADVDHNRNQHHPASSVKSNSRQTSREVSDSEDAVNFTAIPDISFYRDKHESDDEVESGSTHHTANGFGAAAGAGLSAQNIADLYRRPHPNQHTVHHQQQTLTSAHIEFLKSMTGFRKKWTPFELRTCMDIRRIIGSKEYDSLRKNDGMPLPSAKTLRKYKHAVHLDGVDVMSRKRTYREMMDGLVANGDMNGYADDADDIMNAEEPDGHFDINGLSEEQIDFLQSLSCNTKGFSDFELQKTLELKNELGGKNYEILRKQECLHIPTLIMLKKYEQDNGLEDLSAMVVAEDIDEDDDGEPEQEPEGNVEYENNNHHHLQNNYNPELNGVNGEDSHMGIFENHSIFDKDDAPSFDMTKLSQGHIEFLSTLPENPKRWTPHMLNSALDIKNEIGTRDYEQLRRQGIPLPAARTLRRHKDIKTRVGDGADA